MKRRILVAILTSTFVMGGDLSKCSYAIDMQNKYIGLAEKAADERAKINYTTHKTPYELYGKKISFYMHLYNLWEDEVKKECKGILDDMQYNFASEGKNILY